MQKVNRTAMFAPVIASVLMAGVGILTAGCSHDDDARRSEHAGWHQRGSYDGGYNNDYNRDNNRYDNNEYR